MENKWLTSARFWANQELSYDYKKIINRRDNRSLNRIHPRGWKINGLLALQNFFLRLSSVFFFFQIIGQLQGFEGFADVYMHNLREYKNSKRCAGAQAVISHAE